MIGLQRQSAFEQRGSPGRLVLHSRDVAEVIGPAHLVRLERLRVAETTFGLIQELGGHEQPAHCPVRGGQRCRRGTGTADLLLQRGILLAQLCLDGRRGPGDIRQFDGLNCAVFLGRRLIRLVPASEYDHEREQDGRQNAVHAWIPLPSTTVMYRSIGTFVNRSVFGVGEGHVTSSQSSAVARPRPSTSRGSCDDR